MIYRHLAALLLVIGLMLITVQPAAAHANLERSEPSAGALLETAPTEVVITFSEELDPGFSRIQLFNSRNELVNNGPGAIDSATPHVIRLALEPLANDSYTALWRVRSAVDGHITEGSLPFGVGVAVATTSLPPPGTPDPATAPPPLLESIVRWLSFALAAVALGGVPFVLFVWRPVARQTTAGAANASDADVALTSLIRRLILGGAALLLVSTGLYLLSQAASAAGVPLVAALGQPVIQLLRSYSGLIIIVRVLLVLLILVLAWRVTPLFHGTIWRWWAMLAAAAGVLLTFSLNAHGAAISQGALFAIAADWLHTAAMVIWLGGLPPLLAAIGVSRRFANSALPLGLLVPRFSWLSAACVLALALTGLYSAYLHIGGFELLTATTYGRALLVKVGLFVLLVLIGAINLLLLSPKIRRSAKGVVQSFTRTVRAELVIGALLLLAVGAMMSVAPSIAAWEQHEQQGVVETVATGDVTLTLRVAPARIGDNEWAVDVTDLRPGAEQVPGSVLLRYEMQGMEMGLLQTEAERTTNERYLTRGSFTSMGGRWNVEVILRRTGFEDIRHIFVLDIIRRPSAE